MTGRIPPFLHKTNSNKDGNSPPKKPDQSPYANIERCLFLKNRNLCPNPYLNHCVKCDKPKCRQHSYRLDPTICFSISSGESAIIIDSESTAVEEASLMKLDNFNSNLPNQQTEITSIGDCLFTSLVSFNLVNLSQIIRSGSKLILEVNDRLRDHINNNPDYIYRSP